MGGKPRYIAGHLLNDNMGGRGENQNLTVLSSDANKRHRGVEGKVKALAQIADQIRPGSRLGDSRYQHGAEYTVTVLPPSPSGSVPYDPSEKKLASGLEITLKPIRKDIAGNNHPWPEQQGGPNELTKHRVDNVPPYPSVPNVTKVSPWRKRGDRRDQSPRADAPFQGHPEPHQRKSRRQHSSAQARSAQGCVETGHKEPAYHSQPRRLQARGVTACNQGKVDGPWRIPAST